MFAVIGAGVGATTANSAAGLTGVYLFVVGALPLVRFWNGAVASWLDPTSATMSPFPNREWALSVSVPARRTRGNGPAAPATSSRALRP